MRKMTLIGYGDPDVILKIYDMDSRPFVVIKQTREGDEELAAGSIENGIVETTVSPGILDTCIRKTLHLQGICYDGRFEK